MATLVIARRLRAVFDSSEQAAGLDHAVQEVVKPGQQGVVFDLERGVDAAYETSSVRVALASVDAVVPGLIAA